MMVPQLAKTMAELLVRTMAELLVGETVHWTDSLTAKTMADWSGSLTASH
jgi:hypothetical protein